MTGHRARIRRIATVGAVLAVCTGAGAASASASSSQAQQNDLLGLGALLGGVTETLIGPPAASAEKPAKATKPAVEVRTESTSLAGTISKLPLLGSILAPVVAELPLLGDTDKPAPAVVAPAKPSKPAPAAPVKNAGKAESVQKPVISKPEMSPVGSTWTAPRNAGTVNEPTGGSGGGGVTGAAADVVRSVSALLPETAAGKAGMGAAALALIVLGGVAVAGAAGAAGAAGRRSLIGGAW